MTQGREPLDPAFIEPPACRRSSRGVLAPGFAGERSALRRG